MPSLYYQRIFVPGCYYHIYNRGAHQQNIFRDAKDYQTFIGILGYYLTYPDGIPQSLLDRKSKDFKVTNLAKPKICYTLLAFCLMPNHFHFMLRQEEGEYTISNLLRRVCIGYSMYFNDRYHHSGTIFQGRYKNVLVTNQYQWVYLSKYIHRNPAHLQGYEPCKIADYPYSSYRYYLGTSYCHWLDTDTILGNNTPKAKKSYQMFVEDGSDVGDIERFTIDADEEQFTTNGSL
ncbi:MAG: transposase [Microgenomates group bacterium]